MTLFVFANNVNTTLSQSITSSQTTITVSSTANLPSSIASGYALALTLNDAATRQTFEVVYVTGISGSTLTVLRGQEGTTAVAFSAGDYAFSGPTAGQMGSFTQSGASSGIPYDIAGGAGPGVLGASQILLREPLGRDWTCTGAYIDIITPPTAAWTASVAVNGVQVATLNIAASASSGTLSFSSGSSFSGTAGQILEVMAPSTADNTAAGVSFTLYGTVA